MIIKKILKKLFYNTDYAKLRRKVSDLSYEAYRVENELFRTHKAFEYRYYEMNKALNILLYENEIKLNQLHKKEKKNFNPFVSIIIPAYNASQYLNQAIDSALNQTYKNIEIIVVNDGSTDDGKTEKIAKSYGNKIKYYYKKNGGVSSALNCGINHMKGNYFAWLSHDDLYAPKNIEEHIRHLRNFDDNNVITFTNFDMIDENSNILLDDTVIANIHCFDYKLSKIDSLYCLLEGEINGGSVLVPRIAFDECGFFNENERVSQERDMWFRLMKKYKFINIPYCLTSIRKHRTQVTNTNPKILEETNKKRLEIIDSISKEEKVRFAGNEYNFYIILIAYFKNNNLPSMIEELEKRLKKIEKNFKKEHNNE